MSRRPKSESEFGSDSFLDVLANIVGILIILIVIVGARLSHAPIPLLRDVQQGQVESAASTPVEEPAAVAEEPAAPPPPPEVLEPDEPPPEIAANLSRIGKDIQALKGKALEREAALQLLLSQDEETRKRLLAESKALAAQREALENSKVRVIKLQDSLAKKRESLQGVLAEFEQVKGAKPKTQQVRHQVTPISQAVAGEELHFRLSHNRVSVIPLPQLIHRLKGQFEKQKDLMTKFRHHQGSIGPIDGYTLNYIVTRQSISPSSQQGQVVFRIGVSGWELQPESDEMGETLAEALRHGSAFQRALRNAPEKAALTFWVYPDSFAISRKLQSAAHAEGFIVSARPLPQGQPIAGSPNGTRSAGQ